MLLTAKTKAIITDFRYTEQAKAGRGYRVAMTTKTATMSRRLN